MAQIFGLSVMSLSLIKVEALGGFSQKALGGNDVGTGIAAGVSTDTQLAPGVLRWMPGHGDVEECNDSWFYGTGPGRVRVFMVCNDNAVLFVSLF